MRPLRRFLLFAALLLTPAATAQDPDFNRPPRLPERETDRKLPNGKSQNDEILKADYQKTLKDAADLVQLAQALQADLEKETSQVVSLSSLKKTEEIEKIAKRIRGRMRRF